MTGEQVTSLRHRQGTLSSLISDYPSENLVVSDSTRSRHPTLPLDTYPHVVFLDSRISGESLGFRHGVRGTKNKSSDDVLYGLSKYLLASSCLQSVVRSQVSNFRYTSRTPGKKNVSQLFVSQSNVYFYTDAVRVGRCDTASGTRVCLPHSIHACFGQRDMEKGAH
jgi:hypothetical protein